MLPGEFALITLDNGRDHTRPSTLRAGRAVGLAAALDEIEAHVAARDRHRGHRQAVRLRRGRRHQAAIRLIREREQACEWPSSAIGYSGGCRQPGTDFAFVNGAVLGGGLELALHCHYRTLATEAPRRSPSPRSSSASCRAGAARNCCRA